MVDFLFEKEWFDQNDDFPAKFILLQKFHRNEINLFNETWCMNV